MGREPAVALPNLNIWTTFCWKPIASTEFLPGLPQRQQTARPATPGSQRSQALAEGELEGGRLSPRAASPSKTELSCPAIKHAIEEPRGLLRPHVAIHPVRQAGRSFPLQIVISDTAANEEGPLLSSLPLSLPPFLPPPLLPSLPSCFPSFHFLPP